MSQKTRRLLAHVPVISRSYVDFIHTHINTVDEVCVVDNSVVGEIDGIRKDLRRLNPHEVAPMLATRFDITVRTLGMTGISKMLKEEDCRFIMPDDEVSHYLIDSLAIPEERYQLHNLFLRWNRTNITINTSVKPDRTMSVHSLPEHVTAQLQHEIDQSNEWWRQVGCVAFEAGEIILSTHNHYVPTEDTAELDGDIRSQAYRGVDIEIGNVQHAEAALIAEAARQGISLEGADCLVSTFPCPSCAKLLSAAGVKTIYFAEGYAVADGLSILQSADVEVVKISDTELKPTAKSIAVPYIKRD